MADYPYVRIIRHNPVLLQNKAPEFLSEKETENVRHFHRTIPSYQETPLICLNSLSQKLGVKGIYIKDESQRFGLNAFKGLGGIYALSRIVCQKLNLPIQDFAFLQKPEIRKKISDMVFVTATDGNHGKGVAWAAGLLGCKAYIYMPKGSSLRRAEAIRNAGFAQVTITDLGYDDTVRYAKEISEKNGWTLIQDTSWDGYEEIPSWIIQGYTTMVYEAIQQLESFGESFPTHVFLQAGVGAMAGGVTGFLANYYDEHRPKILIAEPKEAACIFRSAEKADGLAHAASGSGITIMAGLNCCEPCTITWPILRDFASCYASCDDAVAEIGMRLLAEPVGQDSKIISGESGAVTAGLLYLLMESKNLEADKKALGLTQDSVILLFNTEGDTDPDSYKKIIHGGHAKKEADV